jgi:hypothetical protein
VTAIALPDADLVQKEVARPLRAAAFDVAEEITDDEITVFGDPVQDSGIRQVRGGVCPGNGLRRSERPATSKSGSSAASCSKTASSPGPTSEP